MNEVVLAGYLGSDIELRYTDGGTPVANARLATDESYTNGDGEKVEQTEWHSLVFWGRKAEVINEFVGKGDFLIVNRGKLQTREWEDRDNKTRYSTEVKVLEFEFGPSTGETPEGGQKMERQDGSAGTPQTQQSGGSTESEEESFEPDDELPF